MKIAGFLVVGEGEAERYLSKTLDRLEQICDKIFIWGNAPDEKTDRLCNQYEYCRYPEDIWGRAQWKIKFTHLVKNVAPYKPDWIVCIDADEELDKRFTREKAEEMAQREEIAFEFYCVQLWDNEKTMRIDGGWGNFWNVRYYRFMPELNLWWKPTPLHCGLAPIYAYKWRTPCEFFFKHYGYMRKKDRERKWARYEKFDPNQIYFTPNWYQSILGKPILREFNEDTFRQRLKYIPKQPLLKKVLRDKIMARKAYIIRNPHGQLVNVNQETYETIKDKPDFQLISEYDIEGARVTELPEKPINELACPICGFEAKTKAGLSAHKRIKHK